MPNIATASKAVGFGSERTALYAQTVVRSGVPELVEAMDRGDIAIRPAAEIARLPPEEQRRTVKLPRAERAAVVRADPAERARRRGRKARKVTIPWSAVPAARILVERWPASLCRELIAAFEERLRAAA